MTWLEMLFNTQYDNYMRVELERIITLIILHSHQSMNKQTRLKTGVEGLLSLDVFSWQMEVEERLLCVLVS